MYFYMILLLHGRSGAWANVDSSGTGTVTGGRHCKATMAVLVALSERIMHYWYIDDILKHDFYCGFGVSDCSFCSSFRSSSTVKASQVATATILPKVTPMIARPLAPCLALSASSVPMIVTAFFKYA